MLIARQSTARTVTVGPVLDADGLAVTSAVVGDFKISKNGGAPAALNGSATLTHRNTGHYSLSLTTSDLDTVGQAEIVIDKTTDVCPVKEITVVEEAVYDALYAASAAGYQVPIWAAANSTVDLSGTTIKTATDVEAATQDIQSRLPAALVGGRMDSDVGAISGDSTAADNLESYTDGTTPMPVNVIRWSGVPVATEFDESFVEYPAVIAHSVAPDGIAPASIQMNTITAAKLGADAGTEIAAAVWDRVLTAATHNIANSAGRRLRQVDAGFSVRSGTAQAGTANTITLDSGASSTDDIYAGDRVVIVGGTGEGEHGIITAYNGTTKVATVSRNWVITPDDTSEFELIPADVDVETWNHVTVLGTDGRPEVNVTRWASVIVGTEFDESFVEYPAVIAHSIGAERDLLIDAIWDEPTAGHTSSGTFGEQVKTIVDNIEADTQDIQSRIPAALMGGRMDSNIGAISGDSTAADNLEAALDGTGGVTITAAIAGNITGNLSGSVGSLATQAKADVNAEVDAAISDVGLTTTVTGRIDAAVSTRASQTSLDTVDDFLDTEVAAIKAKTDNLPAAPAAVGDIPTAAQNAAAWGASVVGNARTRDMYLMGYVNRVTQGADGLSLTIYSYDDTTVLQTVTETRLATTVGGVRNLTPGA